MLERLQIRLRPWSTWEAVDLGFSLLREHAWAVYRVWLCVYLPVAAALFAVFHARAWVAALLMWWLMPAFDRVALHALAKATFGERAGLRSLAKESRAIFRRGTLASLLWRRFSLSRSFTLAVWQLEGQDRKGFGRRAPVLLRRGQGGALMLTLVCFCLLIAFAAALLAGAPYFAPAGKALGLVKPLFSDGEGPGILVFLAPILAAAVIEPFYVAGGFALYLNRRVQLEAWDLELAFRSLAQRLRAGAGAGRTVAALLLGFALVAGGALRAGAPPAPKAPPTPKAELREVLKAPEFQTWSEERRLHWKWQSVKPKARKPMELPEGLMKAIGLVLKCLVVLAAAGGIVWFLWRFAFSRGGWRREPRAPESPEDLFGLDIRPGSLPRDVGGAALALWREGRHRAALSLLYRAALARLVHARGMELTSGATEGDCLRAALPLLPREPGSYFSDLTRAWQGEAYAHLEPPDGEGLCLGWARFEEAIRG